METKTNTAATAMGGAMEKPVGNESIFKILVNFVWAEIQMSRLMAANERMGRNAAGEH